MIGIYKDCDDEMRNEQQLGDAFAFCFTKPFRSLLHRSKMIYKNLDKSEIFHSLKLSVLEDECWAKFALSVTARLRCDVVRASLQSDGSGKTFFLLC